ncbi:MAG: 3-dehydroquinate synthase [Chloroflexia bacterium]
MRNLVITGFMATGKTTVGRAVAALLGRPFVDTDAEIERLAGKSVPRIFAEEGEAGFRRWEALVCEALSREKGLVIATGGGMLVDAENRARMLRSATVVCLACTLDEILRRLERDGIGARPLLQVGDLRERLDQLLATRRAAYEALPWHLDTTGRSVADLAARVSELVQEEHIEVRHPGGGYSVHIGCGFLSEVGRFLQEACVPESTTVAVVSNPTVARLYADRVQSSLRAAGFRPFLCTIPDGEAYKTLQTVSSLYREFLYQGLERSGAVVALGGGVVGDVAGFAAATYLRGVPVIQVPTTLLAMVDAAVGGKTGVNLDEGKNLVGAFHHPSGVVIDPEVLATLPPEELRSGVAEAIKHAVIADPALFALLERGPAEVWFSPATVARALRIKVAVVEQDPQEQHTRVILNLGHTVGHALERRSGYALRHGDAVGLGMLAAARLAVALGLAEPDLVARLEQSLQAWGLPIRFRLSVDEALRQLLLRDKKRRGGRLRWVLPTAIGSVTVREDVPPALVRAVLEEIAEE